MQEVITHAATGETETREYTASEIEAFNAAYLASERARMVVSRFQAMAALMDAGLLSSVNTALAGAGPLAQLAWAEATEFRRNSPTIAGLAAGLGLSDTQVDDLFRAAALITA